MRRSILSLFFLFVFLPSLYPFDWKTLHEKADQTSLQTAQDAASRNPDSVADRYMLGLVYLNGHRDQDAGEVFSFLLVSDPGMTEAGWGLAETARRRHDLKEAEGLLNKALKDNPEFAPALISLAYIRYFQMDFEGSSRLALKVIRLGRDKVDLSNYVRAYCLYAGAKGMIAHYGGPLSKIINGPAARRNLEAAERLQPDSPSVLFGLGSYYLLAPAIAGGNKATAEEYLNKARKADPLLADVYVRLAQLASIKGDKKKYKFYMSMALEIDPGNELALDTISRRCKFICTGGRE